MNALPETHIGKEILALVSSDSKGVPKLKQSFMTKLMQLFTRKKVRNEPVQQFQAKNVSGISKLLEHEAEIKSTYNKTYENGKIVLSPDSNGKFNEESVDLTVDPDALLLGLLAKDAGAIEVWNRHRAVWRQNTSEIPYKATFKARKIVKKLDQAAQDKVNAYSKELKELNAELQETHQIIDQDAIKQRMVTIKKKMKAVQFFHKNNLMRWQGEIKAVEELHYKNVNHGTNTQKRELKPEAPHIPIKTERDSTEFVTSA